MDKDLILAKLQELPTHSISSLAREFNITKYKMKKALKELDIQLMSFSDRLAIRNKLFCTSPKIDISEEANQLILGSLLGDGCIVRKKTNCIFTILHSKVQQEYALYKYNLLKNAGLDVKLTYEDGYQHEINGRKIKNNGRIVIKSKVNQSYNKYREEWYNPKKTIPDSIYNLNALGLAIWFMDDGTSNKSSFYLSTQCFDDKSQDKLIDMLKKNFDIDCNKHKQKNTKILYIKAKSKQRFINLIKPYLCESMNYKIIGHNKQGELLES